MAGPQLPILHGRVEQFESTVASAAGYLVDLWPDDLAELRVEVAASPSGPAAQSGMPRWHVDRAALRITLYRVPIQRLARIHRDDEFHRRMYVENCVLRAVAELLGRDPWDLADGSGWH